MFDLLANIKISKPIPRYGALVILIFAVFLMPICVYGAEVFVSPYEEVHSEYVGIVGTNYTWDLYIPRVPDGATARAYKMYGNIYPATSTYIQGGIGGCTEIIGNFCMWTVGIATSTIDTRNDVWLLLATREGTGDYYYTSYFVLKSEDVLNELSFATQIISVSPEYASTTATSTSLGAEVYINEDNWVDGTYLNIRLVNNTIQNGIGGSALEAWDAAFGGIEIPLVSGYNDVATSTVFDRTGQVNAEYQIVKPSDVWFIGSFLPSSILAATSSMFYVVAPTGLDIAMASTSDVLISALITGTTTQSVIRCNPGTNFDITTCLISLIIPPTSVYTSALTDLRNNVLTHFPLGYVTDFVRILSDDTVSSLTVIDATVPDALPFGQGQHIRLDLTGSLDPILNSTVGVFGTSTDTLYETTSYYWEIIVYLSAFFYILRRILGSHLIPHVEPDREYDEIITPEVGKGRKKTGIIHKTIRRIK